MLPNSDSEATYCSELEDTTNQVSAEISRTESIPLLRRSQRLSQRKQGSPFTWDSVYITRGGKIVRKRSSDRRLKTESYLTCASTPNIFSPTDVREDDLHGELHLQQKVRTSKRKADVKMIEGKKRKKCVPLDLTTSKSKEYFSETSNNCSLQRPVGVSSGGNLAEFGANGNMQTASKMIGNAKEEFLNAGYVRSGSPHLKLASGKSELKPIVIKDSKASKSKLKEVSKGTSSPCCEKSGLEEVLKGTSSPCCEKLDIAPSNPEIPRSEDYKKSKCVSKNNPAIKTPKLKKGRPRKVTMASTNHFSKKAKRFPTREFSQKSDFFRYCEVSNAKWRSSGNLPHTTQSALPPKVSILPDIYPPHFRYQLPPEAVQHRLLAPQPNLMTPDQTQSSVRGASTSSSPSLPESLRGIFDTDDLKQLLNIEKVSTYRLQDYHVRALAAVLGLRMEYLCNLLDRILEVKPNTLDNITKALKTPFVQDRDLFARTSSTDSGSPCDAILDSQSSKTDRLWKSLGK